MKSTVKLRPAFIGHLVPWLVMALVLWFAVHESELLLHSRHIRTGFGFLKTAAGFDIGETGISYDSNDTIGLAILVGLLNTLKVSLAGIVLTTGLAAALSVGRLSSHPLLRPLCAGIIEVVRNTPLLLQLFIWYGILTLSLPAPRNAWHLLSVVFLTNRGLWLPTLIVSSSGMLNAACVLVPAALLMYAVSHRWRAKFDSQVGRRLCQLCLLLAGIGFASYVSKPHLDMPTLNGLNFGGGMSLSPEFAALLIGLSVYSSSYLAEIACAALAAVPRGQSLAARALGMTPAQVQVSIVIPQAFRIGLLPAATEYMNLVKNSSLAVAIGYPELVSVGNTVMNQTGQAVEMILIFIAVYLAICVVGAALVNGLLARLQRGAR